MLITPWLFIVLTILLIRIYLNTGDSWLGAIVVLASAVALALGDLFVWGK